MDDRVKVGCVNIVWIILFFFFLDLVIVDEKFYILGYYKELFMK